VSGFTLLELMAVMAITFMLMGIGTVAIRGLVRAGGISGARETVRAVLTQARQTSIMQRKDVYVIFRGGQINGISMYAQYATCRSFDGASGTLTAYEPYPWPVGSANGGFVYNLTDSLSAAEPLGGIVSGQSSDLSIQVGSLSSGLVWNDGDRIGLELNEEQFLPDSIEFVDTPAPIVFKSNGGTASGTPYVIELREINVPSSATITITVDGLTGWVTAN
jgi:prepilin-type N-terminal cleavage/methylation domain-containing protein